MAAIAKELCIIILDNRLVNNNYGHKVSFSCNTLKKRTTNKHSK